MTLAVIVAVALGARLAAYTGQSFSFGSDESRFIAVAQNLANGYFPEGGSEWFGSRIGLIWPVAGIFQVVSPSDASAAVWPLVGSLLSVVAAYLIGRELGSTRVGLVAAGLVAVTPIEALVGTRLRPDAILPGVAALAVWLAMRSRRPSVGYAALAGIALGLAWTVRESALVLAPVVLAAGWRPDRRRVLAAAGGLVGTMAAVAILFAAGAGAPLRPFTAAGTEGEWRNPFDRFDWSDSYLARAIDASVEPGSALMLLIPILVAAGCAVLYRRDRRAVLPGLWLLWTAAYLEFGTLVNLAKPLRYLTLCTIPVALIIALAVDGRFAWLAPAGMAAICIAALWSLPGRPLRQDDSALVARVAERIRGLPPGPVLTESYTWWAKLRTYTARERLSIPTALDPEFFSADAVRDARRLEPLPVVADARGGYIVTGPVHRRSGWPGNWSEVQQAIQRDVPTASLTLLAEVGDARIWRWTP